MKLSGTYPTKPREFNLPQTAPTMPLEAGQGLCASTALLAQRPGGRGLRTIARMSSKDTCAWAATFTRGAGLKACP